MFAQPEKNIEQFGVDPGLKVADLGSGAGFYSLALARAVGKNGRVFAVDVQQDLLSKLKTEAMQHNLSNIEVVWGDIEEVRGTKIAPQTIDRVVIANTLFQTDDKDGLVQEAARIIKPKGKLLLVDWADSFGGLGPQKSRIVKPDQARALFERAGFSHVRDIKAGDHHYGMVFNKG